MNQLNSIMYPACAAVNLLAFLYKLRILRTDRSPAQWALVGNFLFPLLIFTVSTPAVWVATSEAVGIRNFSGLFTQSCVMLLTACQQLVLLHLTYERDVAWRKAAPRLVGIGAVLVVMVTLFSAATELQEKPTDFALSKAQFYPAYLTVYLIAYAWNQVDVCLLCWRYSGIAPMPWLRRGLRLVSLTLPTSMLYAGCRLADIVAGQFGTSGHAWEPLVPVALTLNTTGQAIGWTMPDWGRSLSALRERAELLRAHRELTPLHTALTAHVPEPVLELEPGADRRTRLYRIVIEIRDAQWALRVWMDPAVAAAARSHGTESGLSGDGLAAAVEAAQLAGALRAKEAGVRPVEHASTPLAAGPEDLAAELAFQRGLARAFAASPVVTAALEQTPLTATPERTA
ncbi:MAB_1171c family putative transporter [Streptoverticillium reticulum]|uniref:MAB_1171c family putative transporter n=1 Tax=Streptoverticillium reticulum TaxID=1433415 RepID=UPI0039BEF92C